MNNARQELLDQAPDGVCQCTLITTSHYPQLVQDAQNGDLAAGRIALAINGYIEDFPRRRCACFSCSRPIRDLNDIVVLGVVSALGAIDGIAWVAGMCEPCADRFSPEQCGDRLREALAEQLDLIVQNAGEIQ